MEQELHQVVRDQEHQAQPVEAKHGGTQRGEGRSGVTTDYDHHLEITSHYNLRL